MRIARSLVTCPVSRLLSCLFCAAFLASAPAVQASEAPLRVAIVGLEHGHVDGFLHSLPSHSTVQLVGIADADPALFAKYRAKYGLSETLFFKSMANMIEVRRPQAVLVYTSVGEHRHAIEIAAQYGVSVMVEKPLTISLDDALAIRRTARHYHIHVLVNYETTWYASNRAAYNELERGGSGHRPAGCRPRRPPGTEGDRRAARVPELAHRPRAERRRRTLRLRLLRRRPDDLAHARRIPAHSDRGTESR